MTFSGCPRSPTGTTSIVTRVVGLVRLGVDVAGFATSGDLVWVVQIEHAARGVTQEVWVSSTTGAVRTMLPPQAKQGQR